MNRSMDWARRRFLQAISAGVPAAVLGLGADRISGYERHGLPLHAEVGSEAPQYIDLGSTSAGDETIPFRKHTLDLGPAESVTVVDANCDGRLDIVCGENWYEQCPAERGHGPRFIKHKFRDLAYRDNYIEDLTDLAIDITGDGYPDIVSCSYWSKPLTWWENPGKRGGPWREHIIETRSPVEFVFLVDLLNTGKPLQLLPQFGDPNFPLTWYELAPKGSPDPWIRHEVSSKSYGHGIGAGDVNGDGRTDIITPKGWFEAPLDPRSDKWTFHEEFDLGATGFIHVADVNSDGIPDLITSLGHDYGIFWLEQKRDKTGKRTWVKHLIDNAWSQSHAMTLADLNGDGKLELITGKRYYAHEHDPGANEMLGIYWYEALNREGSQWRRHILDYGTRTGGGMQIPVVDIDGDGHLDVIVAGKSGLYLFENLT